MQAVSAVKTIRKTANQLEVGDVIQHGNIVLGFFTSTVERIQKSKQSSRVFIWLRFSHGGLCPQHSVGKNAIYDVVAQ